MRFTTLIETDALASRLTSPSIVIADCRFDLKDTSAGERDYLAAHIPGAVYVHLDRDLCGAKTGRNGRHPLPDPETAADVFGRLGIDDHVQVIAYDQDSGMYASRLWWMLRWLGHDAVAVLNGGYARWLSEQRPSASGRETRPPRQFTARPRPEMLMSANDVAARTARGWQLVDARAPERYRGEVEPLDTVAGHIPGALNHFFQANMEEGRFRTAEALASGFKSDLGDTPAGQVICYCGSGVTACHNLLALEHAGLTGAALYAGSWSEWCADPARGVDRSAPKD